MNRAMIWMLIACVFVFGGIFGFKWFGNRMMNQYFDNMPVPAATVSATEARRETWPLNLNAVGTLEAVAGTDVTAEIAGIVDSIQFSSGGEVESGAVLITLDSSTDRAELAALEAQARLAEQELARAKRLYDQSAISKSELDARAAQADADNANVEAQRARIAKKVIRAPFAGELGIRNVDIGQYVSPGTPVVSLQSLDPIYANFRLPQQYSARVRKGLPVNVTVEAFGEQRFDGEITAIEPRIDPSTRNFEAQATLSNENRMLRPGMFARVELRFGTSEDVTVVPQTAITYNPYGDSVWVISKNVGASDAGLVAQRRLVKTGRRRGDLVAITEGLQSGEQVATSGLLKLRNDAPVVINNEVQPSAEAEPRPDNG